MNAVILVTLLVNTALVAFSYGKLWQSVTDLRRRMGRIERILDPPGRDPEAENGSAA